MSARRSAIDAARAANREREVLARLSQEPAAAEQPDDAAEVERRRLIARFREGPLPKKWVPVFEARFLRQLTQREAAAELGMRRTTLAYQELRIRGLLRTFLLERP